MLTSAVAIVVASISAGVSLLAAISVEFSRRTSTRAVEQLRHELVVSRDRETKKEAAQKLLEKYKNPLLRSTVDLKSRIYNMTVNGFRGYRDREYFVLNTLYVIAELLGWIEIIRRELQFLDDSSLETGSGTLALHVILVQDAFAGTWKLQGQAPDCDGYSRDEFYIQHGHQRAIGEIMIQKTAGELNDGHGRECIGYATFVERFRDEQFAIWFRRLSLALEKLGVNDRSPRLINVHEALVDLIEKLDPQKVRVPDRRDRI